MAKKKKKIAKKTKKQPGFLLRSYRALTNSENKFLRSTLLRTLMVTFFALIIVWGLGRMERYAQRIQLQREVALNPEILDLPEWIDPLRFTRDRSVDKKRCIDILDSILLSLDIASEGPESILDETLAARLKGRLAENPWIRAVHKIQKCYDGTILINCEIRRPIARIFDRPSGKEFYLDAEGIVLPATNPLPTSCHTVEIQDYQARLPRPGQAIQSRDIISALEVLQKIRNYQIDNYADSSLWRDIARISIKNFDGRFDRRQPHIMLYTARNVPVRWGTRLGNETAMVEPPADHKLEMLFREYNIGGNGSFNMLKVVELCLYEY